MVDVVKALINLKDGTIQLEGPQEYVEKYLDKYDPMIKEWKPFSTLPQEGESREVEKPVTKRTRTVKPKAGPSCLGSVRSLVEEGYFKEPRLRKDVQERLLSKGLRFESKYVSAALNNLFSGGTLLRKGVGTSAQYYSNV
jgi:hypothetical protein